LKPWGTPPKIYPGPSHVAWGPKPVEILIEDGGTASWMIVGEEKIPLPEGALDKIKWIRTPLYRET
jgi:hypothetical protein